MMESILLKRDGAIATVTLNRPAALNALSSEMNLELSEVTSELELDESVRCVVIQGAGDHFMAGGDVKGFSEATLDPQQRKLALERGITETHSIITRLRRMPKPVIGSVRGAVAGFGMSLMSACDLVIAADNSFFTLAYCHIGASPDGGATYALPRLLGVKLAMEIALLGDRFDAQRALALGLVNRVVALSELDGATSTLATRLAKGPTAVYGRTKRLINESLDHTLAEHLQAEQDSFAASAFGADFAEGVRAFVEKRKPVFVGC
ncbi:MAG: enoyl-CoA hydratase [Comamonadaceae bacterium]|nr:MAG: enoyl-CoA hydratase [Comamonadaceae bacterium]